MSFPTLIDIRIVIEQTLRKSGVRRLRYADNDITVSLATGLRKHGVNAQSMYRNCHLVCDDLDGVKCHSETVPFLMLNGTPTALNGMQGWKAIADWFCQKKSRTQYYGGREWKVHWKGEAQPLPAGGLHGLVQSRIDRTMDQCMSEAQAAHIARAVAPAPAPSRRPRF